MDGNADDMITIIYYNAADIVKNRNILYYEQWLSETLSQGIYTISFIDWQKYFWFIIDNVIIEQMMDGVLLMF